MNDRVFCLIRIFLFMSHVTWYFLVMLSIECKGTSLEESKDQSKIIDGKYLSNIITISRNEIFHLRLIELRLLENSVIEMSKAVYIYILIFNHLNWKPFKETEYPPEVLVQNWSRTGLISQVQ